MEHRIRHIKNSVVVRMDMTILKKGSKSYHHYPLFLTYVLLLSKIREFVERKFGKDKVLHISRMVYDTIRGGIACPKECRLSPQENAELVYETTMKVYRMFQEGKISSLPDDMKIGFHKSPMKEGRYLFENCGAGISKYTINWSGRMYACETLTKGYTEPFENGFDKAWSDLPECYPQSKVIEQCDSCKYLPFCESCPAVRLLETGNWFGKTTYVCEEAKYIYKILSYLNIIMGDKEIKEVVKNE